MSCHSQAQIGFSVIHYLNLKQCNTFPHRGNQSPCSHVMSASVMVTMRHCQTDRRVLASLAIKRVEAQLALSQ